MGLAEKPDTTDPQHIREVIIKIIAKNNADLTKPIFSYNGRDYPRAEILAVVCGGSFFEEGKTPDEDSNVDIDVLYAEEGYFDFQDIKRLFQQELRRKVQVGSSKYEKYIGDAYSLSVAESTIANTFRVKKSLGDMKFIPLLNPRSLIVAKPGYEIELQTLAPLMPPAFSEQPFGDPYYRPTVDEFSKMNLHTSSG